MHERVLTLKALASEIVLVGKASLVTPGHCVDYDAVSDTTCALTCLDTQSELDQQLYCHLQLQLVPVLHNIAAVIETNVRRRLWLDQQQLLMSFKHATSKTLQAA